MMEPPSPTVGADQAIVVVGADEQVDVDVDVGRWCRLATDALGADGRRGELTLTFVDRREMAALNREHMGQDGPTDVLSFPLDAIECAPAGRWSAVGAEPGDRPGMTGSQMTPGFPSDVPVLLGDVVICPAVARDQAPEHAGSLDDELALLVVHGVLHVLGHDHAEAGETAVMREKELDLLMSHHWEGPPPPTFRQEQREP